MHTFLILAFSAVSSLPAFAACRFSDLAVNCGGVLADDGGVVRAWTMTYFELEKGFLEAGHGFKRVEVGRLAKLR